MVAFGETFQMYAGSEGGYRLTRVLTTLKNVGLQFGNVGKRLGSVWQRCGRRAANTVMLSNVVVRCPTYNKVVPSLDNVGQLLRHVVATL